MTLAPEADAERLVREAAAAQAAGDGPRASALLLNALRHDPAHLMAATRLAEIETARKDPSAAIARLRPVLQREPNFAPALTALAHADWIDGRPADGLIHARRAVEIQPPNPAFRIALIQLCAWLGHDREARAHLAALRQLAADDPALHARALGLLAELHIAGGEARKADRVLRQALRLAPDLPALRMAYGMNLLRLGDFAAGWAAYEARDQVPFFHPGGQPADPGRLWSGESLRGRTILIRDEQGNGDAMHFFRYLRLLRRAGPALIVHATFTSLARLFAAAAPFAKVVTALPEGFAPDFHCHSSRLPFVFGTRLETVPAAVPYLAAPAGRIPAHLRLPRRAGLRVGLVWSGDARLLRDHRRSIPAARFLRLADRPDIDFHSLQNVVRPEDLPALEARPLISRIGERCTDFADTASVIRQLDLVITVDTAVAHLAGAMAKPVWILLDRAADWRWLTAREDSPWYPTARLFRTKGNGWTAMLRSVARALGTLPRA